MCDKFELNILVDEGGFVPNIIFVTSEPFLSYILSYKT